MNPTQTVRYYFNSNCTVFTGLVNGEIDPTTSIRVTSSKEKPVFVDVIAKITDLIWKLKLYYPDGTIIKECYTLPVVLGILSIYNDHLLYDGRFNA